MIRISIALAAIALIGTTVGCTMCCHPYDYCGPVYEGQGRYATGCSQCARAGSIFAADAAESMPVNDTPVQTVSARAKSRPKALAGSSAAVPGSERILSVSDRAVEKSTPVAVSSGQPQDRSVEAQPSSPADGWTARRSMDDAAR